MLSVPRDAAPPLVVKDWSQRPASVRALLAPLLIRHELAMLERGCGLPGLPEPAGRIDALAFAMEHVGGLPLRRRHHHQSLAEPFFAALEGILEGLAARGLLYADLSSPSNILVTDSGAPALVDLGSAFRVRVPRALRGWLEGRALAKLRVRFEGDRPDRPVVPGPAADYDEVDLGRERLSLLDAGVPADPVPILLLADLGLGAALFRGVVARATEFGRRVLAVDLPGFGRARRSSRRPSVANGARDLATLLDALRLGRVDVAGLGYGDRVARALALRHPGRVRRGVALARAEELTDAWLSTPAAALRARILSDLPVALTPEQRAEIELQLGYVDLRRLVRARRELAGAPLNPGRPWTELEADVFARPELLFAQLASG